MEMSNLRVESHVAQKSRRDKLRVQQNSDPNQHLEDQYTNNMEQVSDHNHQVLGQAKYGSLSYDPNLFSSEMLSYVARNPQLLLPQNDHALVTGEESSSTQFDRANSVSFAHLSHQIPSKVNVDDPQNSSTWKSIGSQQNCDWVVNYPNGLAGVEPSNPNNFSSSSLYGKPSSFDYHQDLDSLNIAASEILGHHRLNAQKNYGEIHYGSSPICQNNLKVGPSISEDQRLEMASLAQPHTRESGNDSNELLLLPAYGDQSKNLQLNNDSRWINRSVGGCHLWNADSDLLANKSIRNPVVANDNCSTQGLSLSLSSVPQNESRTSRFGRRDDSQDLPSRVGALISDLPGSRASKSDLLGNSNSIGFIGTKTVENTCQNTVGTSGLARSTGPLGPFTGYATILKSSKYLKPTQQLLSESCYVSGQVPTQTCEEYSRNIPEDIGITVEPMARAKGGESGTSSSAFYGSNENISGEAGAGGRSNSSESHRPEIRQKKAKLIFMQEEICRRYKQYHQQMQMVVSSFESVAGLSSATPYISLALKSVTRHFRSLKNAITVQLRHTRKALGEDLSSPTAGTSSSKGDTAGTSRIRVYDHGFQKHHKTGGGFFEPQQPVWRPQRGLPERAVSVLRAWLFDHFLHPYPTDTDKHMLANQTGLTRNQVSNWFINARVRVWKPMVEEIHTLETKALEDTNSNAVKVDRRPPSEGGNRMDDDEVPTGRLLSTNPMSNMQAECSRNNTVTLARMGGDEANPEFRNQEKRSRVECQIPGSMDGSLLGFEPYQQRGFEIGRLGAVSLTLGLRQSAENAQQQQQLQHQEHQLRQQQFGGHMIHDFVG